ncbi:MAG: Maf family protein [Acidobacteriaceae bacterium]
MLVLASASPRRRDLLTQAGLSFQVESISVEEVCRPGEDAVHLVQRLARNKAEAVFHARTHASPTAVDSTPEPLLILGADTVVVCDQEILGKPADAADAMRMLRLLAGRTHQVITGVCLISLFGSQVETKIATASTNVTMLKMSDEEIRAYVATGEPMDKAGAYAIQGRVSRWIPRISGCYFNVVGLPLSLVNSMIEAAQQKVSLRPAL